MDQIRKDLYTVKAYADKFGLTPQAVYYQIKTGALKTIKVQGGKLIKL